MNAWAKINDRSIYDNNVMIMIILQHTVGQTRTERCNHEPYQREVTEIG